MKRARTMGWTSLVTLVIVVLSVQSLGNGGDRGGPVEIAAAERRSLTQVVTGAGVLEARRSVQVSAETSGKVVRLEVREGEVVSEGQLLAEIDPTPARERVNELEAMLEVATSNLELARAEVRQARMDHRRQVSLFEQELSSREDFDRSTTGLEVKRLRQAMASRELDRLQALLRNARHELEKVRLRSDIAGLVTRVNIDEGENAFVGNFNNPATVLLEIADLETIEARIEVDESEIMAIEPGQEATIHLDAYSGRTFRGRVATIGHSPNPVTEGQVRIARFAVVVEVEERIPGVRPGLTCEVDVATATRPDAVAVPIQALVRKTVQGREEQGVFLVKEGVTRFRAVEPGIADDRFLEVVEGLTTGDEIVVGPFETLRSLVDGDRVRAAGSA